MQNNIVKAFRQRLVRAGFKVNYIRRYRGVWYSVSVTSSDGEKIERLMSTYDMMNTTRRLCFD